MRFLLGQAQNPLGARDADKGTTTTCRKHLHHAPTDTVTVTHGHTLPAPPSQPPSCGRPCSAGVGAHAPAAPKGDAGARHAPTVLGASVPEDGRLGAGDGSAAGAPGAGVGSSRGAGSGEGAAAAGVGSAGGADAVAGAGVGSAGGVAGFPGRRPGRGEDAADRARGRGVGVNSVPVVRLWAVIGDSDHCCCSVCPPTTVTTKTTRQ